MAHSTMNTEHGGCWAADTNPLLTLANDRRCPRAPEADRCSAAAGHSRVHVVTSMSPISLWSASAACNASSTQCVSLRETLLQDPNPYQHLNARNLPPLDAELLVSAAFSLIPHLPPDLLDEIALHPFAEEVTSGGETSGADVAEPAHES